MSIKFRPLLPEDSLKYRALRLESLKKCPQAFGSSYETQRALPELFFETQINQQSDKNIMLGAFDHEKLIGLCGVVALENDTAEVVQMYVCSGYRGRLVGTSLLNLAKGVCTKIGKTALVLTVYPDNLSALAAYKKVGFMEMPTSGSDIFLRYDQG